MTYDIVIVGAGPAGLSFARAVANSGLQIALIEKQDAENLAEPAFDGRDIALTHQSVKILKELGIWARLEPEQKPPIREARVLDGTSPYSLDFDCRREPVDALGYLVSNHDIRRTLYAEVQTLANVDIHTGAVVTSLSTTQKMATVKLRDGRIMDARLLVAADSRFSEARRMMGISASMFDFGRVCIVCRMRHEQPHRSVAYECFNYGRTLAVLPLNDSCSSVVITAPMDQKQSIMEMSETQFNDDIQERFDNRYGRMQLVTERFAYPLVGVHASKFYAQRFALIGDAAVGMHPVTAHGYNLGLSGQKILADEISRATDRNQDIGSASLLKRYHDQHARVTRPMFHGTNQIVRFFTDDRAPAKMARKIALRVANRLPPIQRYIKNRLLQVSPQR